MQQRDCTRERRGRRRLEPAERRRLGDAPVREFEHGLREVRARDLRRGRGRSRALFRFAPEPDADTGRRSSGASGALIRTRMRDRSDQQAGQTGRRILTRHPREPGIDDRRDAVDRHRCLRDVRREDDLAAAAARDRPVLFRRREPTVQRQHLGVGRRTEARRDAIDLADAGQERQRIAVALRNRLLDRARDTGRIARRCHRSIADRDRVRPPLARDDRRIAEERRDRVGLERRGHHDDAEIGARLLGDFRGERETEVALESPLVELVEHDRADAREERIRLHESKPDPVRNREDARPFARAPVESYVITDLVADRRTALACDPPRGRARGDAARLDQHDRAGTGQSGIEDRRRDAGGLAGAGRRLQHDAAAPSESVEAVGEHVVDREWALRRAHRRRGL